MPASVTSDVDLGELGEPDRRLGADLAGVGQADDPAGGGDHGPLGGGLVAVGGGQPVVDAQAVGAEEGDVGAEPPERARRCRRRPRPGWWAAPGRAAGAGRPAALPASRAATGHRVRDDGEPQVAGEQAGQPAGGGAGVEQHGPVRRREQVEGGPGDPVLLRRCWPGRARRARPRSRPAPRPAPRRRAPGAPGRSARATERSRRTVSVVTSNCSAIAFTDTRPRSVTSWAIACWRSSAYMLIGAPAVSVGESVYVLFYARMC